MVNEKIFKKLIVFGSVLALLILSFIILWPILLSLVIGLILAYIFYPLYYLVLRVVKEKNISSLIIVLLILFLLFLPLWFLFPVVSRQLFDIYTYSQKIDFSAITGKILPEAVSTDTIVFINTFISKLVSSILSGVTDSLMDIPNLLLQAVVILFVFFFAMRDGEKLKEYVKSISPFTPLFEGHISRQFKDITNSVLYGFFIVGIIQGIVTGIGLFIFGVPQPLILTIVAIIAAIIPVVGAWIVWIPAAIYLFIQGHTGAAIGLALYGAILVSWIDNIIRPYLISRKINISSAVVLVGMIGGLMVFGILGLLLGPLILSYLIILLDAYREKKLKDFFSAN